MKYLRKTVQVVLRTLWYLMAAALVVTLVQVAAAKYRQEVPQIAGYSLFRITTGSMEPAIPTGTYILVEKTPADRLKIGDVITFYSEDPAIRGLPNTHRITQILRDRNRDLAFVTRGDHNMKDDDLPVGEDQIIGRYVKNLPRLTEFVDFFMQESVIAVMLLLQAAAIMFMNLYNSRLKKKQLQEQQEAAEALEQKKRALIDAEIARLKEEHQEDAL